MEFMAIIGLAGAIVMGYGDGFAGIIGKSFNSPSYKIGTTTKTLAGSFTMLCITYIILSGFLAYCNIAFWYLKAAGLSIILTIIEAISIKGTDNLTVPVSTIGLLLLIV